MVRKLLIVGLLIAALAAGNAGCCVNRFGPGCGPIVSNCGDCHGVCGGGAVQGYGYGGCDSGCCSPCSNRGYGCVSCLDYMMAPFSLLNQMFVCSGGCGDIYWDEWISDPPDCCDPCDPCANWNGTGCCVPRWSKMFSGWPCFVGYPYGYGYNYDSYSPTCGCDAGCDSGCGGGCGDGCGGGSNHGFALNKGEVIYDEPQRAYYDHGVPTRSALRSGTPTEATPPSTSNVRPSIYTHANPYASRTVPPRNFRVR